MTPSDSPSPSQQRPPRRPHAATTILSPGTYREYTRLEKVLTRETTSGTILVLATIAALILANSGAASAYFGLRDTSIGFELFGLDLNLTIGHWAADGLLSIFFFMVGLELKKEFVKGDLRDPGRALVPITAAAGGVAMPAIIYTIVNAVAADGHASGWAIPAATDIAFAVAVLALVGSKLPAGIRTFLLTLAIVDDLLAIVIIAVFYSQDLQLHYLAIALIPLALYWFIANKAELIFHRFFSAAWFILLPIGGVVWALFLNSGIHATIAGVILAFLIPVKDSAHVKERVDAPVSLSETLEHRFSPLSSGVAVPVFAFFSAGVAVGGLSGLLNAWSSAVALGVILGLMLGKIVGIVGSTFLITRLRRANLDPSIQWIDLVGVAALAGIGFTVSLLVSELSFDAGSGPWQDYAKVGVLSASVIAAVLGSTILLPRNARYAKIHAQEQVDANQDGIPDVFSDDTGRQNTD